MTGADGYELLFDGTAEALYEDLCCAMRFFCFCFFSWVRQNRSVLRSLSQEGKIRGTKEGGQSYQVPRERESS